MRRSKLNTFLMCTLLLNLAVGIATIASTSAEFEFVGPAIIGIALFGGLITLGVAAAWQLYRDNSIGEKLCAIFYAIQMVEVHLADGSFFGATCGVAVTFRVNDDANAPILVNIGAILLFILSLAAMGNRRISRLETEARHGI